MQHVLSGKMCEQVNMYDLFWFSFPSAEKVHVHVVMLQDLKCTWIIFIKNNLIMKGFILRRLSGLVARALDIQSEGRWSEPDLCHRVFFQRQGILLHVVSPHPGV